MSTRLASPDMSSIDINLKEEMAEDETRTGEETDMANATYIVEAATSFSIDDSTVTIDAPVNQLLPEGTFDIPNKPWLQFHSETLQGYFHILSVWCPKQKDTVSGVGQAEFINADEFLVDDVRVGEQRHLLFATQTQLQHLSVARRWFMDGSFKVVRRPFYQLMSIHYFVRGGENVKQVPLLFVLMTRRTKQDYVAVLRAVRERLGDPIVEWFMLDFEAAAWQAVTRLGLAPAYTQKGGVYHFVRKLLALPYLPAEHVRPAFLTISEQAEESESERILDLVDYIGRTWVEGTLWRPENWSVYMETVRTNNDVERWHRRLNTRAGGAQLPFYVIVPLLSVEAQYVDIQARLVSANILQRLHRKKYRSTHEKLHQAWEKYEEDNMTTNQLEPRTASHIIGLGPIAKSAENYSEDE
ncbi:uncharacterized protein LOC128245737 [Mya arenaria]|uniref:uncharacterized protein LOC128245737 n=1 Tax=Mya arenaria TaxID=6604 RepID=UPI0022E53C72|nr:uncharacterized protein LOC128245737 [Mya arenaria]